jgi:hypothetical protein
MLTSSPQLCLMAQPTFSLQELELSTHPISHESFNCKQCFFEIKTILFLL